VVKAVWVGESGGYAALTSEAYVAWGANVGDGSTARRPIATKLSFDKGKLTSLAIGAKHACAVFDQRSAYCWGDGAQGQLGSDVPQALAATAAGVAGIEGDGAVRVAVGREHTCLWTEHRVRCFGQNAEGQSGGLGDVRYGRVVSVAAGEAHSCVAWSEEDPAKKPARGVTCHGRAPAAPPEPILVDADVRALVAGANHTCAVLADGSLHCWGRNDAGQLGDGTTNDTTRPTVVHEISGVRSLALGTRHTCVAQMATRTIACWGDNRHHQLANGTVAPSVRPVLIPGVFAIIQVAAAGDSTCAVLGEGELRCWGANERGQLGDDSTVEHDVPMPVKFR
jgi:alpha-tubulin suppressor-like RCC1 family protein